MNSNRQIEIDKSRCNSCDKLFFEFKEYELEFCPHCNAALDSKGACDVEETIYMGIEVDFRSGKLKLSDCS